MIKGFKPESALLSSAILDFVENRLHKILRRAARRKRHIACDELFLLRIKISSRTHSATPPPEPDSLRWIPVRMRDENIQIVHALQVKSYISVI